jgi:hypothetical protein
MRRWAVYIHSHPSSPSPHTDRNLTRPYYFTRPPSTLQHGLPSLTSFLPSITPRVHYPPFPSYVCLLCFRVIPSYLPLADIRDARDAHIILEAVRLNILPLITRRLSSTEREQLSSGNVFVWEEAEFKGGLERWTDGRRWQVTLLAVAFCAVQWLSFHPNSRSQSRMRGDYLFYEEKLEATQEERDLKAARRCVIIIFCLVLLRHQISCSDGASIYLERGAPSTHFLSHLSLIGVKIGHRSQMVLRNRRSRRRCTCQVLMHRVNGTSLPIFRYGGYIWSLMKYVLLTHPSFCCSF